MANLIFYDETHKYTVNGIEVPSVSELTRFISKELYGSVNQFALDAAAERGTKVHKATEALDKFGSVEVDDEILPYIQAYLAFRKDHQVAWERIEWPVNNGELYAGTLDRYGTVDGESAIVDFKTTGTIGRGHRTLYTAAQNLYRMAIEKDFQVKRLYVLQLKKNGKYKLYELEIQNELANACIALHTALKIKKEERE